VPAATVVLWRHGRTAYNQQQRFQGQLDVPLDPVGERQVRAAAVELALLQPSALVASDLSRAVATAAALTARTGLVARLDPALREVHAGEWQGLTHDEITARWPEDHAAWRRGDDVRGGEKRSEMADRAAGAVERHAAEVADGRTLVVAAHGAALKGALLQLLGLDLSAWTAVAGFRNAHWAVLRRRSHGWALAEYNVGPPGAGEGVEG
jgi:broad specificity phosphatase PhoE